MHKGEEEQINSRKSFVANPKNCCKFSEFSVLSESRERFAELTSLSSMRDPPLIVFPEVALRCRSNFIYNQIFEKLGNRYLV